ncbi:MAG: histidine ammonia-lyase [Bdellovibrionaceae bacterium]|nr:histidine ammonia-lyase [Pseudobdellovibrionaceae bacterium]
MKSWVDIAGEGVTVENIKAWSQGGTQFRLAPAAREKVLASRAMISEKIRTGEAIYGVNTGFGAFSSVRISDAEIEELQRNLIRSHSAGIGEPFTPEQTRAIMILRANTLARGHSGVRPEVIDKILEFLNADCLPVIPGQGSVGASGDLAPLSHLALGLMGEGPAWNGSAQAPMKKVLSEKSLQPLVLQFKEGLSLINGCQVMTAVGMLALYDARDLAWLADAAGAQSLEGLLGSRNAFDPLISAARPHTGEIRTAKNLRTLLSETSEIAESHRDCNRVQDAYSLRCMPAVHGAVKDGLRHTWSVLETEANSSTDNPLVFTEGEKILSCGNFHGMPVAFSLDYAAIVLSAMASISEQRISKLINPAMSGLPAFLAPNGGLNSGHMIVQVAAASLVSENKVLAHPASVDSIPTSADKEDHVSMGTIAARKLVRVIDNVRNVIAMELLSGSQAVDLVRPLKSSKAVEALHTAIRKKVPFAPTDRIFADDVTAIREMIQSRELIAAVESAVGPLEF